MSLTTEVTSPAAQTKSGDAQTKSGPSNLQTGQAAVLLMAQAEKAAKQPVRQAAEEVAPAETAPAATTEEVTLIPTAEAPAASEAPAETETAETEAPAAEEAPAEEEADAVHSQTISFTPEQQEIFNKRVGKEVAKTKALKAQMEETKTKLAELEAKIKAAPSEPTVVTTAPMVVNPNIPLGDVGDIETLGKRQQTAKEVVRYVEEVIDNPNVWKTVPDPNDDSREIKVHQIDDKVYTEGDLKRMARQARVTLEDHIPQRANFLAIRQQSTQQAHTDFPFLKDKQSPGYQLVEAAKRNPAMAPILSMPNSDWLLAAMAMSVQTLQSKAAEVEKAKTAPAAKPRIPAAKPPSDQTATSASGAAARAPIGSADRQRAAQESAKLSAKGGVTSKEAVGLLQHISRSSKR